MSQRRIAVLPPRVAPSQEAVPEVAAVPAVIEAPASPDVPLAVMLKQADENGAVALDVTIIEAEMPEGADMPTINVTVETTPPADDPCLKVTECLKVFEENILGTPKPSATPQGAVMVMQNKVVWLSGAGQTFRKGMVLDPQHYTAQEWNSIIEAVRTESI